MGLLTRAATTGLVIAVVTAVLMAVTTACGASSTEDSKSPTPSSKRPTQSKLLADLITPFRDNRIAKTVIGTPPPQTQFDRGAWLYFTIRAANDRQYARGVWEASIVAGLFRDIGDSYGWPDIRGRTFSVLRPSGSIVYDGSSIIVRQFSGVLRKTSEERLTQILRSSAAKAHLEIVSVRFIRLLGRIAIYAVARAPDGAAFLSDRNQRLATTLKPVNTALSGRPLCEGTFLEVETPNGRWLTASGYSTRTGTGIGATNR
jgi:hypothetical protein